MNRIFKSDSRVRVAALVLLAVMVGLVGFWGHGAVKAKTAVSSAVSKTDVQTRMQTLPLVFEPNRGQTDSRFQFFARSSGYKAYLAGPTTALVFTADPKARKADVVSMKMVGANPAAQARAEQPTGGVSNYYLGNDRSKWLTGIPNYAQVRFSDMYPGIDVVYQGNAKRLRYDFQVKPGADPKAIRMAYEGNKSLSIDQNGNLLIATGHRQLVGQKPYIYQEYGNQKHVVDGSYVLSAKNEITFQIGQYDTSRALVIDPTTDLQAYGTYLGPQFGDTGDTLINGVAEDGAFVYVTGTTSDPLFPGAGGALVGGSDVFVSKLPLGTLNAASFNTIIGGVNNDEGNAIAVQNGSPAIVGQTSSGSTTPGAGFPTVNPLEPSPNNIAPHAFVARLSAAGALQFSTLLSGGSLQPGVDDATGVAIEQAGANAGRIHVSGSTSSSNFLGNMGFAANGAQNTLKSIIGSTNAFYVAINPTGSAFVYATFYGGGQTDVANGIAVDSNGKAYIAGTSSSWISAGGSALFVQKPSTICGSAECFSAGTHAFAASFDPSKTGLSSLVYALPIGVSNATTEMGNAIAVDSNGNAYVGGNIITASTALTAPVAATLLGTPTAGAGAVDGFLMEIKGTPTVVYATLVNGDEVKGNGGGPASSATDVTGVAVDSIAQAYITGSISSIVDAAYTPAPNPAAIIHRRAYAGGTQVTAGTPFFVAFPSQTTVGNKAIEPTGDIPVGPGAAGGTVAKILITNGGGGYTNPTNVTFSGGGCTGEPGTVAATADGGTGAITMIPIPALTGCTSNPTVVIPLPNGGPGTASQASAVAFLSNDIGVGTSVAYDSNTGTSCLAGYLAQALPTTVPSTTAIVQASAFDANFPPNGHLDGVIICTPFINDVVITSSGGLNNSTLAFASMAAGSTTAPPSLQISAVIPSNPNIATFPAPGAINYSPHGTAVTDGPNSGSAPSLSPGLQWLQTSVAGDTITLSVNISNASKLDPGLYTATFTVTPAAGDNAGVPIVVTVTLSVTGVLDLNNALGGGNPAPTPFTYQVNEGIGFVGGGATKTLFIPVVSEVPFLSPSLGDIAFLPNPASGNLTFTGTTSGNVIVVPGAVTLSPVGLPAGEAACSPRPNNNSATSTACYIGVTIPSAAFNGAPVDTYTSSLAVSITSPNSPAGAPVTSAQVPTPTPIPISITTLTGVLAYTGGTQFAVPFGFSGLITSGAGVMLDATNMLTTTAGTYTATQVANPGTTFTATNGATTCSAASPSIPGTVLQFPPSGALPAANANPPTVVFLIGISNPSTLTPGYYESGITVTPAGPGVSGTNATPLTIPVCLSVGTILNGQFEFTTPVTPITSILMEAGAAAQTPTFTVSAIGPPIVGGVPTPTYGQPTPIAVPETNAAGPSINSFVTVAAQVNAPPAVTTACPGAGTACTTSSNLITISPPFNQAANTYNEDITATAGATTGVNAACFLQADLTCTQSQKFTLPITVTSGLTVQYPQLQGLNPANTFVFNEMATTGVVTGTDPVCPSAQPCKNISVQVSGPGEHVFVSNLTFSPGVDNFLDPFAGVNVPTGACKPAAGIVPPVGTSPGSVCTLSIELNTLLTVPFFTDIQNLPVGQYRATFDIDATTATPGAGNNGNGGEQNPPATAIVGVQPAVTTVTIILNVTPNNPTITASPVAPFSYTIGTPGGATVPPSQNLGLAASFLPLGSANIAFTATPVSAGNFILLNGGTGTVNGTLTTNPAQTQAAGGGPVVISINTAALTVAGSPYNGTIHVTIPNNGTNPQVTDPTFDIGVTVNVFSQPTIELNGATAAVPMAFSWTVGQAATAPPAQTATVTVLGQDTYTITTNPAASWLLASFTGGAATSSASSNTLTVSIDTTKTPTIPGNYPGTVTITGNAAETATVNVTLTVHAAPTITASAIPTLTIAAGSTSTTLTSNVALSTSPDNPTTLPVSVGIVNAAGNPASCGNFLTAAAGNPASLSGTAQAFNFTANETGVAPGMCSATVTFTTTGGITPALTQSITVTMNVQGSIGITCGNNVACTTGPNGNTTLNFTIGAPAPSLPIIVTTNPTPESVTLTSDNAAVAVSPQQALSTVNGTVSLNTALLTTGPQTLTATITASVPASALNCANPVGGFCTQSQTFTVNVSSQPIISLGTNPNLVNGGLLFNEIIGGGGTTPNQLTQNLVVAVSGGSATFTATATDLNCTNCITVPPGPYTATNPGTSKVNAAATVPVTVNLAGLAPGSYFGTITLAAQAPATGTVTVPVTLVVAAQPTIGLTNTNVTLKHTINVTNAATNTVAESVTATNTLNQPYPFTATVNAGASWLLINGSNTTPATGNTPGNFTIGYNPSGLAAGTYNGTITVSVPNAIGNPANGSTSTINVTLTVSNAPLLQAQGVALNGVTGGAAVSSTINVTSSGSANGDEIAYTITSNSVPAGWLTATAVGGTTTTPSAITVTATPGNLQPGTYNGTVTLTPTNASLTPITLNILFNVVAPTVVSTLSNGQTTANFTVTMNNPASASAPITLSLSNSVNPSSPVTFTASASPSANWLSLNGGAGPVTGTTGPNPATITLALTPAAAALPAGSYSGLVTINFTGSANSSVTIPVTLTVNTPPTCTFTFSGSGTLPFTGTATVSATAPNGVFPSTSTAITVTPSAGCVAGTTFTVTADHPEWLTVTPTATGFSFVALANAHTTGRSATVTVTPTNVGTSTGASTTFSITEPASTLTLTQRQVVALYQQILGREPDQGGFNFWTGQGAGSLGQMADSFLTSPEAMGSDFAVLEAYQGALGRFPSFNEYQHALLGVRAGSQTISGLFTTLLGTSTNSTVITTSIYLNLLGRAPTAAELTAASSLTPFQVFTNIIGGAEFMNGTGFRTAADHTNSLYIKMLYFVILQRDTDNAGFNFWLGVANGGGPGVYFNNPATRITIEGNGQPGEGFIGSNEFQGLFQ